MVNTEKDRLKGKGETFFQGILILMLSQVIIKIMGLVQSLYLTNRKGFGDDGNAIYMGSYQIYALLLSVSSIGIPTAISKLVSERIAIGDNNGAHKIFKVAMLTFGIIGIVGTFLLFFGAEAIARYWIEIPESKNSLMILAPAVFFVSIDSVFRGYFSGMQKMKATANSQSLEQFFKTVFAMIFVEIAAFYTMTNTTYMAAMATAATSFSILVGFVYLFIFYIKERKNISIVNLNYKKTKKEPFIKIVKTILWLSIPISLTAILTSLIKLVDSFTVVKILKPILGETVAKQKYGILSAKADILATLPLSLNVAFTTALVPAISAANAKGDDKTINKRISLSLLLCLIIGLPCTVGMFIYSKEILLLLFPYASEGGELLAISALTIIFAILSQTINGILQGYGNARIPVIALGIGLVVKIIANGLLLPIEGIYEKGAAIANVLCHLTSFIIVYKVLLKTINFKFSILRLAFRPILATITMAIFSYIVYKLLIQFIAIRIATVIAIFVAIIIFTSNILILKIFSKEEILMLPKGEKIYRVLNKMNLCR